jgi:hypothetical protein
MIAAGTLSAIAGHAVGTVRREAFGSVDALSGATMFALVTDVGERYVVKRMAYATDWIMQATEDHACRAAVSWTTGLLDQLPPEICHEVLACAKDGAGWALLLRDVGPAMIPPGDDLVAASENERLLDAMAALHARFWGQPELAAVAHGFCSLPTRYAELAPRTMRAVQHLNHPIPPIALEGWALLPKLVEPDVAEVVEALLEDPSPLCAALERFPMTVVHGDWKLGNLGIHADSNRVVLLDWAIVGPSPSLVDLGWYLAVNCARLPISKEVAIATYRASLERRLGSTIPEGEWRAQLELSLLGAFIQLGWPKAYGADHADDEGTRARERAELDWWSNHVRAGAAFL